MTCFTKKDFRSQKQTVKSCRTQDRLQTKKDAVGVKGLIKTAEKKGFCKFAQTVQYYYSMRGGEESVLNTVVI